MRADRLLVLREYLKTVPQENFNMATFWCGTAGCAAGHACKIPAFQEEGLSLKNYDNDYRAPYYADYEGFDALEAFFELTYDQTEDIFSEVHYGTDDWSMIPVTAVIKRIDKVISGEYHAS